MPLNQQQIDDVVSTTMAYRMPTLTDNVYQATPLFKMLDMRDRITADGGSQIEVGYIFALGPGGSYSGMDPLNISRVQTKSLLQFPWKQYYFAVTVDGLTRLRSGGVNNVVKLVDTELQQGQLTLQQTMGTDVFLDGNGNNSKALTGLDIAIGTTGVYGGINRASDAEGPALRGQVDSIGGVLTLPAIQSSFGAATFGPSHPDIMVTTQKLFDQVWMRIQPQQRGPMGPIAEQIASVGFPVIMVNGVILTVDQKCPSGTFWQLNTDFIALVAHIDRANIEIDGPVHIPNGDGRVWKGFWAGNLVVHGPRYNAKMTGLSES